MKIDLTKNRIDYDSDEVQALEKRAEFYYEYLHARGCGCSAVSVYEPSGEVFSAEDLQKPMAGWVDLPEDIDEGLLADIEKTAEEIKKRCSLAIVVGIGGSYLGTKALFDALNGSRPDWPDLRFAGYNMSAAYMNKLIRRMEEKSTCLIVISKSGRTVEPLLSYSVLKEKLYGKYGYAEARRRIFVVTDEAEGDLRAEADREGYKSFPVPRDIGGRYSVLSAVGLFPLAVAGHDVRAMLAGALSVEQSEAWKHEMVRYAVARNIFYKRGQNVEIFEYFDVNLRYFGEWLKQLFGESEGKDGKGVFPSCLCFTRDLHSIGQFLQQGNRIFFETMIRIEEHEYDFDIPESAGELYAGKTMEEINSCAEQGVIIAHENGDIPMNLIQVKRLDAHEMGALVYFFEMSCAISAYLMGVNPFDQPGVEAYKREMKRLVEMME